MAKTLGQIELLVREYTKTDSIVLSVEPGLSLFNSVYRSVARLYKWPELRDTIVDDTIVTSTTTNVYPWPNVSRIEEGDATTTSYAVTLDEGTATTSQYWRQIDEGDATDSAVAFWDVVAIEVGNDASSTINELMLQPRDETEWGETGQDDPSVPTYYLRKKVGSDNKIELRPAPNYSGGKIEFTGYVEPDELTKIGDTTVFQAKNADNALARLIASEYYIKMGEQEKAAQQVAEAEKFLAPFKRELTTSELKTLHGENT